MKMIASVVLFALTTTVYAASTSDSDMPDEVRALLMKEKSKGTFRQKDNDDNDSKSKNGGAASRSGCNLDIGNVNSGGRTSGAPRNVTTIVTGPVIQMNNKCN